MGGPRYSNPDDASQLGAWGQVDPFGNSDARRFQASGGTEEEYRNLTPEQKVQWMHLQGASNGQSVPLQPMQNFVAGVHSGAKGPGTTGSPATDGSLYSQLLAQSADAGKFETEQRLNPTWDNRENAMRARLLNQGLDPTSEASQNAMGQFGRDRNDAYASALNASQDSRYRNALNTWIADTNAKMGFANNQQAQLADLLTAGGNVAQAGVSALSKYKPSPADGTQPIGYDNSGTPYYSNPDEWDNPYPYSGG